MLCIYLVKESVRPELGLWVSGLLEEAAEHSVDHWTGSESHDALEGLAEWRQLCGRRSWMDGWRERGRGGGEGERLLNTVRCMYM